MIREKLKAVKRSVIGKKVKLLRKQGLLPCNVYGKKIDSTVLQVDYKDLNSVFKKVGETGLVDLKIDGEEKVRPVLIHEVQRHPVSSLLLHADFYQVDLKEKIKALIPVIAEDEAPAVAEKKGVLLHVLSEVEVESLPTDLPERFVVSLAKLKELDESILVKDLSYEANKITILTNPEEIIFKIGAMAKEEEVVKPAEEAAVETPAEGESAETPAETPSEEKKEEKS